MNTVNTDKITRKLIETLSDTIISAMPKKHFTTPEKANKYLLTGDSIFSSEKGNHFTCGFAKGILTPDDIESGKYFIAGYGSNNPADSVLDDMYARAIYIDDNTGRGGVVICSVDAVGISRHDINDIRKIVIDSGEIPSLKSISVCATHTHGAIDTQGLWGEKIYKSGRNEAFMTSLKEKTAQAIISAYKSRKDGKMFYSVCNAGEFQYDHRHPSVYDENLTKIRFEAFDGSESIQIINFACHAELMGDRTKSISADFPCYMLREIENESTNALYINGAIGGMISAKEIKKVYRNEIDCIAYAKEFGRDLGKFVNAMTDEIEIEPVINVKSSPVNIEATNFVLILARLLKVLNNDILRGKKRNVAYIATEVGYMELGSKQVGIFLIPGELFPELWNGEFLSAEESATGKEADYKVLKDMTDCDHNFVVGLCNDELGYILPDNDFLLNEKTPYIDSAKDRFGRGHYEETNSTGIKTARTLLEETDLLIYSAKSR